MLVLKIELRSWCLWQGLALSHLILALLLSSYVGSSEWSQLSFVSLEKVSKSFLMASSLDPDSHSELTGKLCSGTHVTV